jgi:hypothetical protein
MRMHKNEAKKQQTETRIRLKSASSKDVMLLKLNAKREILVGNDKIYIEKKNEISTQCHGKIKLSSRAYGNTIE